MLSWLAVAPGDTGDTGDTGGGCLQSIINNKIIPNCKKSHTVWGVIEQID